MSYSTPCFAAIARFGYASLSFRLCFPLVFLFLFLFLVYLHFWEPRLKHRSDTTRCPRAIAGFLQAEVETRRTVKLGINVRRMGSIVLARWVWKLDYRNELVVELCFQMRRRSFGDKGENYSRIHFRETSRSCRIAEIVSLVFSFKSWKSIA